MTDATNKEAAPADGISADGQKNLESMLAASRAATSRPATAVGNVGNVGEAGEASATGQRCGVIAIVGKPNVGKSTLLNALVGQKISITSRKAQTTRHRITGIHTREQTQFIFVDTPGFQTRHATALNKSLNKTVMGAIGDVDLILFVVEAGSFT
ncbi:MAG: GTPase Era, partial [Giesbergeria sp.]|nr:GTPase Era [Giesbergeria sp.]